MNDVGLFPNPHILFCPETKRDTKKVKTEAVSPMIIAYHYQLLIGLIGIKIILIMTNSIGLDPKGHLIIAGFIQQERILKGKYLVFNATMIQFIIKRVE